MAQSGPKLDGQRILVVEDEHLIAVDVVHELEGAGAIVVGPAYDLREAFGLVPEIEGAVLDFRLGLGETTEKLAQALSNAGVPFVFYTGSMRKGALQQAHPDAPVIDKGKPARVAVRRLAEIISRTAYGGTARLRPGS